MHVQWKPLLSLGLAFWAALCYTDFLGECPWRKYSEHLDEVLTGHRNEIAMKLDPVKDSWSSVMWNIGTFLCALVILSVLRSISSIVWKILKMYNAFKRRNNFAEKASDMSLNGNLNSDLHDKQACKVLFASQAQTAKLETKRLELIQEHVNLCKQIEDLKKEKSEVAQMLNLAQKDNLTARQQIEEYKLETFMMKEKLQRTANTLKENLKYKDFAYANQEMITRKAHSLEVHLKEVSKDRELLRTRLSLLEKNYAKLEEQIKMYEQRELESSIEQVPEKDTRISNGQLEPVEEAEDIPEPDVDMSQFQKKIMDLQQGLNNLEDSNKANFEANSKISVDLEDVDTSKETFSSGTYEEKIINSLKKTDINLVKQNLLNYSAYKIQMLRPKLKLNNESSENKETASETTSSSDDNNSPQRLISSTAEFQNFLRTLQNPSSNSSLIFQRNAVF